MSESNWFYTDCEKREAYIDIIEVIAVTSEPQGIIDARTCKIYLKSGQVIEIVIPAEQYAEFTERLYD
jgi:hypothetical protein